MLKTMKITAAALMMGMAFTAPASAQIEGIDPAQAKTVADEFIKCAGLYGAMSDILSTATDAESVKNTKGAADLSAGAQISAMVLYVIAEQPNLDGIDSQVSAQRASYKSTMQSGGLTDAVQSQMTICGEMGELQTTLVEIAAEALK